MTFSVQQMADRVAELMEARLGVKGNGLSEKLRKGGHRLPKKVLGAALFLAKSADELASPKMFARVDVERNAIAYDRCVRYLKPLDASRRWRAALLRVLAVILTAILAAGVMAAAVLYLRGLL